MMTTEIKGFLETSFTDWAGKICSVLFLSHCNFRCPYCHNHPLVFHPDQYPSISIKDILGYLRSYKDWIDGVCLTGGEPTLSIDLPLLIQEIRHEGFLVKLDTNGSNPQMLENLIEMRQIDFVSMDVKAPLDSLSYQRSAGLPINLNLILRSIEILKRGEVDYEFRMTVVPELHKKEDIKRLGSQLRVGPRLVLQNFNPENPLDPSLKETLPYPPQVLREMEREIQGMM
jgi:pyruvate formate lyase activating enzyme